MFHLTDQYLTQIKQSVNLKTRLNQPTHQTISRHTIKRPFETLQNWTSIVIWQCHQSYTLELELYLSIVCSPYQPFVYNFFIYSLNTIANANLADLKSGYGFFICLHGERYERIT